MEARSRYCSVACSERALPIRPLLQFGRSNPLHLVISAEDKVDRLEACTASLPPVAAEPDAQQEAAVAVAAEPDVQQAAAQSKVKNPVPMPICKCFGSHNQSFRSLFGKGSETSLKSIEIARAGVDKGNLQLLSRLAGFAHSQCHPRIRRIP